MKYARETNSPVFCLTLYKNLRMHYVNGCRLRAKRQYNKSFISFLTDAIWQRRYIDIDAVTANTLHKQTITIAAMRLTAATIIDGHWPIWILFPRTSLSFIITWSTQVPLYAYFIYN